MYLIQKVYMFSCLFVFSCWEQVGHAVPRAVLWRRPRERLHLREEHGVLQGRASVPGPEPEEQAAATTLTYPAQKCKIPLPSYCAQTHPSTLQANLFCSCHFTVRIISLSSRGRPSSPANTALSGTWASSRPRRLSTCRWRSAWPPSSLCTTTKALT